MHMANHGASMPLQIDPSTGGCILHVKVVPNSSRQAVAGILGTALKIKVAQPPEGGRANHAVIEVLAETLHIAPARITLVSGQTQPQKRFFIQGFTPAQLSAKLAQGPA